MKTWKTIVEENNLDVSIVHSSDIGLFSRIDAEYYRPLYFQEAEKLCSKRFDFLGNLVSSITGGATPLGADYFENGIPFLRVQNIMQNYFDIGDVVYISSKDDQKLKRSRLKSRDVLLTITGASYGKSATVTNKIAGSNINQHSVKMTTIGINPYFLSTFLNCFYGKHQSDRNIVGLSRPALDYAAIKKFIIPIPSNFFQTNIEHVICESLQKLEQAQEKYQEAEKLLLKEINLEGYVPSAENISVRELAECLADNRFDAEYWQIEYDAIQNAIKTNKDGFDTLDNLFEIDGEKIDIDLEKEYLYAELADVNGATGTIDNLTPLKGADLPSRGRMKLKRNDLIVSSVEGSLEKIALVSSDKENIVGSTGFFVLRAKEYEPEVALSLLKLKPIQKLLKRQAQGTILTAIPKSSLSRVLLPKINSSTQQKVKGMVSRSHMENQEAKALLEKAKRAVEIFIEKDEQEALKYLIL